MDLFIAVVFACVGSDCNFYHSQTTFSKFKTCMQSAAEGIDAFKKHNPQLTLIDGACLRVPMRSA